MKSFARQFAFRGLLAMGFGPVVIAIVFLCLEHTGAVTVMTPTEAARAVLSTALMAFIAGGVQAVYTVERLPVPTAALIHGAALYADYLLMYLLNGWIPGSPGALGLFTAIFVVVYAVIWLIIYLTNRRAAQRLTRKLVNR
ncbi:MAG: DUF3021 domain-containing protein [Clostridia bacterium]|nr:DUF3021 domain-containing protein [Clostridia bacterium]